jgi:hypothetical protein
MGNQLFEYATAKALAARYQMELRLDTSVPDRSKTLPYRLHAFALSSPAAQTGIEQNLIRTACSQRLAIRPLGRLLRATSGLELALETRQHTFDASLDARARSLPDGHTLCLHGYWQCPEYFASNADMIRREFRVKQAPSPANQAMLRLIQAVNSVSLHIRRGDYLALKHRPALALAYYVAAVQIIAARVENPHFFVISDDIAWAKQNLRLPFRTTFVDVNRESTAQEDLRLMSACRHHVIANSTFSWWGAWLNPRPDKLVVAPKYWSCTRDSFFPEMIPPGWICLENMA